MKQIGRITIVWDQTESRATRTRKVGSLSTIQISDTSKHAFNREHRSKSSAISTQASMSASFRNIMSIISPLSLRL